MNHAVIKTKLRLHGVLVGAEVALDSDTKFPASGDEEVRRDFQSDCQGVIFEVKQRLVDWAVRPRNARNHEAAGSPATLQNCGFDRVSASFKCIYRC